MLSREGKYEFGTRMKIGTKFIYLVNIVSELAAAGLVTINENHSLALWL